MKKTTLAALALVLTPLSLAAQDAATEIEGVISDQLTDFNNRDITGAWEHASPMIKRLFGNPGNFGMMVQNGYPMVWNNKNPRFLDFDQMGDRVGRQMVMIDDPAGVPYLLEYNMIRTDTGWMINGVRVIPAPDVGV